VEDGGGGGGGAGAGFGDTGDDLDLIWDPWRLPVRGESSDEMPSVASRRHRRGGWGGRR